ncbi:MAG TPA: hypothetical protein HA326_07890 [Thermoplasmata archaeon]|nr:hypothetical protein [Thermoplasmata archaeon]
MYRVFRVPANQLSAVDLVYRDNLAGRQSITVREARTLGLSGEGNLVLIEGSEDGVGRAEALLKEHATALTGAEAESAYRAFRAQDDEAASGLGLVFGG